MRIDTNVRPGKGAKSIAVQDAEKFQAPLQVMPGRPPNASYTTSDFADEGQTAFHLSIDGQKLAQVSLHIAANAHMERNREALTELAKW